MRLSDEGRKGDIRRGLVFSLAALTTTSTTTSTDCPMMDHVQHVIATHHQLAIPAVALAREEDGGVRDVRARGGQSSESTYGMDRMAFLASGDSPAMDITNGNTTSPGKSSTDIGAHEDAGGDTGQ